VNSGFNKSAVLIAIWVMMGLISMSVGIVSVDAGMELGLGFVLPILIALVSTIVMWGDFGRRGQWARFESDQSEAAKRKRGTDDKFSLLMELMDDDERAAFKEALMRRVLADAADSGDGELPYDAESLEALPYDDESTRVPRRVLRR